MSLLVRVGALICSSDEVYPQESHLLIQDGNIVSAGPGPYLGNTDGLEIIDKTHSVAMPGFINCHGHAAMTLLRGAGDDLPLMAWLSERVFPMEDKLTKDAIYWGTQLACWEMLRSGTTCFTDMYMFMHDTAKAVDESGMRAVLSWGMVGLDEASAERGIRNSKEFVSRWNGGGNGRIMTTLGPHAPYTCPPQYLRRVAELSAELDVPMQIHLSETRGEVEDNYRDHGCSPIAHAKACGLFERPLLAAHCVHVSEEDMELLSTGGVHVAHNPQSNLKLGSGVAPIVRMKAAGILVGLGTDGAASNNNLDMFEEMRLAATLHKGVLQDATVIPAAEAFDMATVDGAKCIFLPREFGVLKDGSPADFILLDLHQPHFTPSYDLLSNVVYSAGADDVSDVFIAGRQVLDNGLPTRLDIERIRHEVGRIQQILQVS